MRVLRTLGRAIAVMALGIAVLAIAGCDCCSRRSGNGLWSNPPVQKADATDGVQVEKSKTS